jgi:hypothetical protein
MKMKIVDMQHIGNDDLIIFNDEVIKAITEIQEKGLEVELHYSVTNNLHSVILFSSRVCIDLGKDSYK